MSVVKANTYQDATGGSNAVFSGVASPPNGMGFRSRIINGGMAVDQRNAGASVTAPSGNTYSVDRWLVQTSQASKLSFQRNAGSVTPPAGFQNYLGITSSSAYSVAAGDYFNLQQRIEGFNVADLGFGTASAQAITVSFWVRSSLTGTFGASVRSFAAVRTYPFTYTISSANTWEQKTVTIPGDTNAGWLTDNGIGMVLLFGLGYGATYGSGTAGAWTSSTSAEVPTGSVSVVGTNGATFYITGVQLEAGTVASPFERRDYGRELMMCQRYFENNGSGWFTTSSNYGVQVYFRTTKRATPTISVSSGTVSGSNYIGTNSFRMDTQGPLDVTSWSASSEL